MPRKAKTLSGAPAQPIAQGSPGMQYGQGVEMTQMQRAMPAPQVAGQSPAAPSALPAAPGQPQEAVRPDFATLLAKAGELSNETGMLNQPTGRPNEPVTAGLVRGPGGGPEMLAGPTGSPAGDILRRLSASTGDPMWAELARKGRA